MRTAIYLTAVALLMLTSCAPTAITKSKQYSRMYEEKPMTVLVMPPINRSTKVEAKELFYSSLAMPLASRGYYVMPPILAMEILKEESAYDAEMFIDNSMKKVGETFGVDAVLFSIIHNWAKTTIASQTNVKIEYILKSTKTDEVLFRRVGDITVKTGDNSSIFGIVAGMIATAVGNEIVVGKKCNMYTLTDIPSGKYSPNFGADGDLAAGKEEFQVIVNQ